jgi:hypothetical protein
MTQCPFRSQSRGCDERYCMMWIDGDCIIKKGFMALAQTLTKSNGSEI